jgi:Subtilase family
LRDEGHPMLNFRRFGACCAAGGAVLLTAALGAPGAQAAPGTSAKQPSFGAAAVSQLLQDVTNAWKISQGNGVTVAVLSSGVDPNTLGLQGKVTVGPNLVPLPYPVSTDGTILASAIAGSGAAGNNGFGTVGRAPQAKILSIRVWPDSNVPGAQAFENTQDWQDTDAKAITDAVNSGAKVIVVDWVGGGASQAMETAVHDAISHNDVVICDEDGFPDNPNAPLYPCALPGVLGAASVNLADVPPATPQVVSPVNESILVAAPANQLFVSGPDGPNYDVQNDYAAMAWLAGTAALIKSVYPNLAPSLVARAIAVSARDHPAGGYNMTIGFGLINPDGALQQALVLSKLSGTAAPGPGLASPSARLASGPPPGVINAVRHSTAKLAGFGGAVVIGLACLIAALVLGLRRRPAAAAGPVGPVPFGLAMAVPPPGSAPFGPPAPAWPGQQHASAPEAPVPPAPDGPAQEG